MQRYGMFASKPKYLQLGIPYAIRSELSTLQCLFM